MTQPSERRTCDGIRAGLVIFITLPFLGCSGDRDVAAETARHLHSDIVAYEVMLSERISHEKNMHDERLAVIHDEESDLLGRSLDEFRLRRSAELASAMIADPERHVRTGSVIHFLNESVQAEYDLYRRLQDRELAAASEFEGALTKLYEHRERLAQMEEQVAGLATRSKLRTNNKLLMSSVDDLLDQLESDQRNQVAARRKSRLQLPLRLGLRSRQTPSTSTPQEPPK